MLVLNADENCIYGIPAEVAAPSKRGPSAFILALLTELSSASPLREEFTLLPLAQASGRLLVKNRIVEREPLLSKSQSRRIQRCDWLRRL